MSDYANNLSNELLSFKKSLASNNRTAIDQHLLQIKNLSEEFLNQALFWCIENYKVEQQTDECLHILLRYNSENSKSKPNPNCEINFQTPLIAACRKGIIALVKRLIENGAKPDLTNSKNQHPLEFLLFSRQQNYDVADYLISQMQSVNFMIKNKHPILIAMQKEYYRIFKSIIEKGCDLVFEDGNLLHFMIKQKFKNAKTKKKFLKELTTKHYLFTQMDKNGKIPIDYEENEEIKAYYLENFKIKKTPQPLLNSVQKTIGNNSSIFINTKSGKKETKSSGNDKKKSLYDSSSFIGKPGKQTTKQTKIPTKETKDEDVSFEQQIYDKSEGELQQEEKFTQKLVKPSNQAIIGTKKTTVQTGKNAHNASFVSNSSSSNYPKEVNKVKSKYSGIGSKTETNLRNSFVSKKYEPKKISGLNSSINHTKDTNSKKKNSFEDDKKDVGSSKKISILQDKGSSQEQIKLSKIQRCQEIQKTTMSEDQGQQENLKNQEQNTTEEMCRQVEDIIKKEGSASVETLQIENDDIETKLPQRYLTTEILKRSEWQIGMESCQKLMEQFIIKEEHEITDLRELKAKFNQIFQEYGRSNKSISYSEEKIKQSQKLKELKTYNNESNKPFTLTPSKSGFQKEAQKQMSQFCLLKDQISLIQTTCAIAAQKKSGCIREAINFITKKVQFVLQSGRKEHIEVSIETYGSRANGLEIQTSDTDLLIICNVNAGVKDLMMELERSGAFNCKQINEVKYLSNTSMPIMKLSLNQDFMHMNIDLTFQIRGHTGIRCTSLIKQFIAAQELLKPLVITLKTLLNCYELCDTYTGGVGSYSLTLMTIALLQFTEIKKTKENLGEILLEFLLFYGFQMDYICQAIIIHPPGFNERPAFSIYQLPYSLDLTPKLIIYDPLNPVNNVGRATYRIVQLKKLFKIWYVKLRTQLVGRKDGLEQLMKMKNQLLQRTAIVQN